MRTWRTRFAGALAVLGLVAGCSAENTALRQISPGATVYIDGWDDSADSGDQALVEQKPSGMWVLPVDAPFRVRSGGDFTVKVTLDSRRGFVVTDLGGTLAGKDHDDCLEAGETYAFVDVPATGIRWEGEPRRTDSTNDDCQVIPAE
ncbi:hypothetical protein [Actinocorallia populi]|uniref:hypothetical protein n=1 Tax=Actinocorallia populi TaxID=2079200 RepID=UPI0013009B52|nr:hypothetical protein [Actinocorallia populi]